jgi:hypothetical protein
LIADRPGCKAFEITGYGHEKALPVALRGELFD